MEPIVNPFLARTARATEDDDVLTPGARSMVSGLRAARARDPIDDEISAHTQRKTDIGRMKAALDGERDAFLKTHGPAVFESDPLEPGKFVTDPATRKPVLKWGGQRGQLEGTEAMIRLRQQAASDPDAAKRLVEMERHFSDNRVRLAIQKWERIEARGAQLESANTDTEARLGELAQARLARGAAVQQRAPAGARPAAPEAAPARPGYAIREMADGSARAVESGGARRSFPSRSEAESHYGTGDRSWGSPPAASPPAPAAPEEPPAAAPGEPTAPAGTVSPIKPIELIRMHRQVKDAEVVARMDTSSEELRTASQQKADALRQRISDGMAALPTDGLRQRVIDSTRDPTFWEEIKNFGARAAEGAGTAIVDVGEFAARQGIRAANAVGATEIDPANNPASRFADAMREVASEWGPDVAKEVQEKLRNSAGTAIGQATGSTLAFLAPGMLIGRMAKAAGMADVAVRRLITLGVGLTGSAATGNSLRREADLQLRQLRDAGQITTGQYQSGVAQAEAIGALIGTSEVLPIGRFAERLSKVPAGQAFLTEMFKKLAGTGTGGVSQWLKGAGKEMLHRAATGMGEGFEEAVQEFGQSIAENLTAGGKFGNVAWDPERQAISSDTVGNSEVGFLVGALFGAATAGRAPRPAAPGAASTPPPAAPAPDAPPVTPGSAPAAPAPDAAPEAPSEPIAEEQPQAARGAFEFQDKTGQKVTVEADGIKAAIGKLPAGFEPDLSKTRPVEAPRALASSPAPAAPAAPAAKPLPADIEFLAEQSYTKTNGVTKRIDFYQVDRSPENPRGRTVDEDTLRAEGYDLSRLPEIRAKKPVQGPSSGGAGSAPNLESGGEAGSTPAPVAPDSSTTAAAGAAHIAVLEGEKLNRAWTAFSPESQSLGIPRAEMPQVKAEHRGALTQFLKARGVASTEAEVLPADLKPTQAEFSPAKVQKARDFKGGNRAILVSSDNHVVDGHHQWMAKLTDTPAEPMRVIRLEAPIRDLIPMVGEFPSAETAKGATKPNSQPPAAASDKPQAPSTSTPAPGPAAVTSDVRQEKVPTETPKGAVGSRAPAPAISSAGVGTPTIARGANKPARFVQAIAKAAGLKGSDRATKFLTEFAPRLHKANPKAFEQMEVRILTQAEWDADPAIQRNTPNSAGAFKPSTNTLLINADKAKGEAVVDIIVHEAGHFAEKFALGEEFTQAEWEKLTDEQRIEAAAAYDPAHTRADLINDPKARSEWVAMQFARVVRGDTKQMPETVRARLQKWLEEVRALVRRWLGDEKLTTKQLDAAILEKMGYASRGEQRHQIGFTKAGHPLFEDAHGVRSYEKGNFIITEAVALIPTRSGVQLETPRDRKGSGWESTEEIQARTSGGKPAEAKPAQKPTVDRLADDLFDGLLGTPGIAQEAFPRDRREKGLALADAMIEAGITTPDGMARFLDEKFEKKARKYSDALWSLFRFSNPNLPSVGDWGAVYGAIDNPAGPTDRTPDERASSERGGVDAGERDAGATEQHSQEPDRGGESPARGVAPEGMDAGDGVGVQPESRPGQSGGERRGGKGGEGLGQRGPAVEQPDAGEPVESSRGGDPPRAEERRTGRPSEDAGSVSPGLTEADENHRIGPDDTLIPGGDKTKARANIAALKLLKTLEKEGRNPTKDEKRVLAQYVGWGGIPAVFDEYKARYEDEAWRKDWGKLYDELKSLLSADEWRAAARSTINAHYTSREVISPIWSLVRRLGFRGGVALETSAGIGHFLGLEPTELAQNTKWRAVELDDTTGRMLKKLYPQAQVQVTGFQDAKIPNHSVDLVIGNFPFAKDGPMDDRYPRLSLHNYFFARSMDTLKPGGLIVAISSNSTMDSGSSKAAREWLAERADLVGAVRLPNTAFKKNAGTEVTTDILVLRKRGGSAFAGGQNWINVQTIPTHDGAGQVPVNEYFARNPEMMLGRMSLEGTMYRGDEPALIPNPGQDLAADLATAIEKLPENVIGRAPAAVPEQTQDAEGEQAAGKEGSVFIKDGRPYEIVQGVLKAPTWASSQSKAATAKSFVVLRDHLKSLISSMAAEGSSDKDIEAQRAKLNELYDRHVKRFGPVNGRPHSFLEEDPELPLVQALEDISTVAKDVVIQSGPRKGQKQQRFEKEYRKATIFTKRTIYPRSEPTSADTMPDAIAQSLAYRNAIDVGYVASLRGITEDQAEALLAAESNVFRDPKTGGFETSDAYLSGFVRIKLDEARKAAADDEGYRKNVEALEKNQPDWLPIESIAYRLGSSWLPPRIIQDFLRDKLHVGAAVTYIEQTGHWKISPQSGWKGAANVTTFGTTRLAGHEMVEDALNLKTPTVYDEISTPDGTKREKNTQETLLAQQKQQELKDAFREYVGGKAEAHPELEKIYNDRFNGVKLREYTGPAWEYYPNASTEIKLRQHQKDVTTRILQDSTLLAHSVGTGKTFIIITAAMEMRRLGMARKPMIVTQNATTQQFAASFKKLYPTARILVPTKRQREAANRKKLVSQIATGDYDSVIIPQSFLNQLPDDPKRLTGFIEQEIEELVSAKYAAVQAEGKGSPRVKDLEKAKNRLEERLRKLSERKTDDTVTFEQLGVDALFVDEAHAYKKLEFQTQMENIKGLDRGASERGLGLYMKSRWIQERNNGKNVVLATGTPVSNTIAEAWNMLRFVRPDLLTKYHVEKFDDFASTFGDTVTNIEQTAGGTFKQVTRFAKYTNGPELIALFHSAADVVLKEDINLPGLPALKNGQPTTVEIEQTPRLSEFIDVLRKRLEAFDNMSGREKRENSHIPLVTFGEAKKATLDLRLIASEMPDEPGNKLHRAVDEIARIYHESTPTKGTQLVFADLFQSPDGIFNLYRQIREELEAKGVPPSEVAVITDAKTDAQRERMFDGVKSGDIRIMLGSTEKMGVGVNVQDKLIALHHLDAPHRPMDIEQRNGRIIRQGNENPIAEILNYGVKNTLDATLYQRLAIKQKFINQIMRGDIVGRSFEDAADEVSMTFEEQMAAFSGNPLAMKKVGVEGEVRRLQALKQGHIRKISQTRQQLESARADLANKQVYQPKVEAAALRAAKLFAGEMQGDVAGGHFADRKALSEALDQHLSSFMSKQKGEIGVQLHNGPWSFPAGTVKVHGLDIQLSLIVPTNKHGMVSEGAQEPYFTYEALMEGGIRLTGSATTGGGLLMSLTHGAKDLKNRANSNAESIVRVERDIMEMAGFLEQPFQQEGQLKGAIEELDRIERMLTAPPAPPSPPPAAAAAPAAPEAPSETLGTPAVKGTRNQEEILAKVTGTLEDKRGIVQRVKDYVADLRDYIAIELQQKVLDRFTAIKRLERAAVGTNDLDASVSAYKWSRLTSNLPSVMEYLLQHGRIAYRNGAMVQAGGKGLAQILKPIIDSGKLRLWEGYAAAVRANRLLAEGKEKNFGKYQDPVTGDWLWDAARAQNEINELLDLANSHQEFEPIRQEYVDFQKSILDVAESAGLINPEKRALWEKSDYVPFYRIVDALDGKEVKAGAKRRGFSGQRSGIRKLKGGPQQVAILENMVRNIENLVDASFKNVAMLRIADLADQNTDLMVNIPYKAVPFKSSYDETVQALEAAGVDISMLTKPEIEELVTFWRMRAPEGKDIVSVMRDGKPTYYRVKDKPLLRSILALGPDQHSWWMKLLMLPKRGLTSFVTLDPAFMAANTIRDSFSAWVISDTPIKPGLDSAIGFAKSLRDDPSKLGIMAAGGGSGHYNNIGPGEVRATIDRMTKEQRNTFLESVIDTPKKALRLYKNIGRATENANRIAIYDSAKKRGASDAEAAFQALDIMDFGLRGDSRALAFFLDTVPFMNARIQGLYRLGRGLANDPKRVATHGAIIIGATLALLARNWDDDRYWDLPEWDRDLYYHFWFGDQHVRIPKPFEVGQVFSTVPERFMEFAGKTGDAKLFGRRLLSMVGDTFAMNPMPQAIKPVAERAMNRSALTGNPIISRGDEFKDPEQQFNAFTSATAREIADAMPDSAPEWMRSPKTLDYMIRGYFGTMGIYALDTADALVKPAAGYPADPAGRLGDYWIARRFVPENDTRETKYVGQFYELHNSIEALASKIRRLRESGEAEAAARLTSENADRLAFRPVEQATYSTLADIRKQERALYDGEQGLTPEERRRRLVGLAQRRNQTAKQTVQAAPRRPAPFFNPFLTR